MEKISLSILFFLNLAVAADAPGIGRTDRDAVVKEKDSIQTVIKQTVNVLLDDGTEVLIGPSSRVTFSNWTERDKNHRLLRTITLDGGMVKVKVRKTYSQDEPFLVENKYGVAAVRGTEFVVEAGSGGRLERARRYSPSELAARKTEVEVHTLEGEVQFAPTREALEHAATRVSIMAGQTSLVRLGMARPQQTHEYDLEKFRKYLVFAAPAAPVLVLKNTTNARRAERSMSLNLTTDRLDSVVDQQKQRMPAGEKTK